MATTQATLPPLQKQLEQQHHVLLALIGRFPSQEHGRSLATRVAAAADGSCRSACRRNSSSSARTCAPPRRNCIRPAPRSASPSPTGCRNSISPRRLRQRRVDAGGAVHPGRRSLERRRRAARNPSSTASRSCIRNAPPRPPTKWPTRNIATPCSRAFQNVADALRALQLDAATLKAQQRAMRAASDTLDLSRGQYRLGAITYVTLLNAERSYEQARLALVQAQAARYADTAALFAGARRRLVEPQRCGAGSVQPRAATRPSRQRSPPPAATELNK